MELEEAGTCGVKELTNLDPEDILDEEGYFEDDHGEEVWDIKKQAYVLVKPKTGTRFKALVGAVKATVDSSAVIVATLTKEQDEMVKVLLAAGFKDLGKTKNGKTGTLLRAFVRLRAAK